MADLDIEHLQARLSQDPDSPLFARLADLYLAADRPEEALALAEHGAALYPSYAAGQIVLGRCRARAEHVREARTAFHRALELSPHNALAQHLLVSLPAIVDADATDEEAMDDVQSEELVETPEAVQEETHEGDVTQALETEELAFLQEEEEAKEVEEPGEIEPFPLPPSFRASAETDLFSSSSDEDEPPFDPFPTFEEYVAQNPAPSPVMTLDEYLKGRTASASRAGSESDTAQAGHASAQTDFESLAHRLQNAPRIVPAMAQPQSTSVAKAPSSSEDASHAESDLEASASGAGIVTPTMAEIYASQNEFQAAIDAYEELIKRQPEQAQVFQRRIDAIRLLIGEH